MVYKPLPLYIFPMGRKYQSLSVQLATKVIYVFTFSGGGALCLYKLQLRKPQNHVKKQFVMISLDFLFHDWLVEDEYLSCTQRVQ